jgi:hypothetical protein
MRKLLMALLVVGALAFCTTPAVQARPWHGGHAGWRGGWHGGYRGWNGWRGGYRGWYGRPYWGGYYSPYYYNYNYTYPYPVYNYGYYPGYSLWAY